MQLLISFPNVNNAKGLIKR